DTSKPSVERLFATAYRRSPRGRRLLPLSADLTGMPSAPSPGILLNPNLVRVLVKVLLRRGLLWRPPGARAPGQPASALSLTPTLSSLESIRARSSFVPLQGLSFQVLEAPRQWPQQPKAPSGRPSQ